MADVGVKIANPGFDATKAAGYQLLYNSSWPSISITYENSASVTYDGFSISATFTHGLGFYPFCNGWLSMNGQNIDDFMSDGAIQIDTQQVKLTYSIRSTTDILGGPSFDGFGNLIDGSLTATFNLKCYNIDLSAPVSYPFYQSPTYKQPYNPDIGFKVAKTNKNVDSPDLRDFIVHSRGQSPTVLSVLTEASAVPSLLLPGSGTTDIIFTNPQGYVAWVYGFIKQQLGNGNIIYNNISVGGPAVVSTPTVSIAGPTFTLNLSTTAFVPQLIGGTLLVLRDPMFAANTVNVTY